MASNRINRINEEMQKSIAGKLRSVKDPRVAGTMISVTRVETTPDLRYAKSMSASWKNPRPRRQ